MGGIEWAAFQISVGNLATTVVLKLPEPSPLEGGITAVQLGHLLGHQAPPIAPINVNVIRPEDAKKPSITRNPILFATLPLTLIVADALHCGDRHCGGVLTAVGRGVKTMEI